MLHQPRLLILDEATTGLDQETELAICAHIRELCERTGLTVLAVSHQQAWQQAAHVIYRIEKTTAVARRAGRAEADARPPGDGLSEDGAGAGGRQPGGSRAGSALRGGAIACFGPLKLLLRGDAVPRAPCARRRLCALAGAAPPRDTLRWRTCARSCEPTPIAPSPSVAPVDIVIPVHDGLRHLQRLFATLFEHTDPQHRFLLADDASTDPAVRGAAGRRRDRARTSALLRSEANLGFVATVNRAMAETTGHAILLNTDTEVPRGWVERLMRPIVGETRIASATPFSNSAAMFGFPAAGPGQPAAGRPDAAPARRRLRAALARLRPEPDRADRDRLLHGREPGRMAGGRAVRRGHVRPWLRRGDRLVPARRRGRLAQRAGAEPVRATMPTAARSAATEKRAILDANLRVLHRRWPAYIASLQLSAVAIRGRHAAPRLCWRWPPRRMRTPS